MPYTLKDLLYKPWEDVHYLYTEGRIDDQKWAEYQWCWRNSTPRLSSLSSQYERTKAPSEECERAITEYLREMRQIVREQLSENIDGWAAEKANEEY